MYIQLHEDGTYWRQIKEGRNFEFSDTCFQPPETLTPEEAALYRAFPLTRTERPAFSAITHTVVEADPVLIGSDWTQQWIIVALPPEVAATNQVAYDQQVADSAIRGAAKVDSTIQYLLTHSAAEIEAKVQAEVANLAAAKVFIAKLAVAVGVLARRELR